MRCPPESKWTLVGSFRPGARDEGLVIFFMRGESGMKFYPAEFTGRAEFSAVPALADVKQLGHRRTGMRSFSDRTCSGRVISTP